MSSLVGRPEGSKNKRPQHKWSNEEKEYLKEITTGKHYIEIVELMNEKFEYEFNIQQVKGAITRYGLNTGFTGRFEKGKIPFNKGTKGLMKPNKTSFKKGNIPKSYRAVGSERVTKDGYIEVKVDDPNKWELNTDISNLRLVTRKQLLFLNNNKLVKNNSDLTDAGIKVAEVLIKINDVKRKK